MLKAQRWVGRGLLGLAGLLVALKLASAAGTPSSALTGASILATFALLAVLWRMREACSWLDGWRVALLLLGLWSLPSVYPYLRGDGVEYYVLLRSPLFDGDLSLANDFEGFGLRAPRGGGEVSQTRVGIGVAVFWLPLVLAAHVGAKLADALGASVPADGFSPIYQAAATTSTFLYGFGALLLLDRLLRPWYGPALAFVSVAALYFATPLHFYMLANPFMSHGISAFAATLFIAAWLRARGSDPLGGWFLAGVAGGLMALVRATDGLLLLPPLIDMGLRPGGRVRRVGAYLAAPVALGLVQAAVWQRLWGPGFIASVREMNYLGGLTPHVLDILFSARHGLYTWTPLYVGASLGWFLWIRRDRRLGLLFLLGFALAVLVNSLFKDWWGSDSFGQRRFLSLTPFFALGLGETLSVLVRRPLIPVCAGLTALALWNLQFEGIYNNRVLGERGEAASLERHAAAEVDAAYRWLVSRTHGLPPRLWVLLYDDLKGVWLDEGPRSLRGRVEVGQDPPPLPFLIGAGWYKRTGREGDIHFRWSRGGSSWLYIPILSPGDFHATLRGRLEMTTASVSLELCVNGEAVGRRELAPGWQDYPFDVPSRLLQSGLNALELRYSTTPRKLHHGAHVKNTVIAVETLWLERRGKRPL